jgi:hypothetical protein
MATKSRKSRGKADDFLRYLLSQGPLPARTVKASAEQIGFSWRTITGAKKTLGVVALRTGGIGSTGQWVWSLPDNESLRKKSCQYRDSAKDANFHEQIDLDL